jgi:hypothetical protein
MSLYWLNFSLINLFYSHIWMRSNTSLILLMFTEAIWALSAMSNQVNYSNLSIRFFYSLQMLWMNSLMPLCTLVLA